MNEGVKPCAAIVPWTPEGDGWRFMRLRFFSIGVRRRVGDLEIAVFSNDVPVCVALFSIGVRWIAISVRRFTRN